MDKRIENGIINVKERRTQMTENNIHILESVKDILTIANTDLITVQMGADYYEVGLEAINSLIKNNRDELIENGLKIYKKKDFLKEIKSLRNDKQMNGKSILTFNDGYELVFPNRGMYLMSKRTLAYIGLILKDSEIAREYRKRLGLSKPIHERKEMIFIEELEKSLLGFGEIKGVKQYNVLNYRVDYFIPLYNVVIEYDENDHKNYTYEQQEGRQQEIENELVKKFDYPCKFIRVSDKNSNSYNIGLIFKELCKINPITNKINYNIKILNKAKQILTLEENKLYSLNEVSNLLELSEMTIYKTIKKINNINKDDILMCCLELNNDITKEIRSRILDICLDN